MDAEKIKAQLQAPFAPEDIEWKPQTSGIAGGGSAFVLAAPYVTNRAIQARLDEVFGVFGWSNEYRPATHEKGYLCGITVKIEEHSVTRWDGAESTRIEPLKGGLSNSMKRAAVQFGIGRYLYTLPEFWAPCIACDQKRKVDGYANVIDNRKKNKPNIAWNNPTLPDWAMPVFDYQPYITALKEAETLAELKDAYKNAWRAAEVNQNEAMKKELSHLKDELKESIEVKAARSTQDDIDRISAWVDARIGELCLIPNAEAIKTVSNTFDRELTERCLGTFVDHEAMRNKLKEAITNRLNELEGAQA